LAGHFLQKFAGSSAQLTSAAQEALLAHNWPGNVRELCHVIERASILAEGAAVDQQHITIFGEAHA
jgi:two-component system response regulator GlrR